MGTVIVTLLRSVDLHPGMKCLKALFCRRLFFRDFGKGFA